MGLKASLDAMQTYLSSGVLTGIDTTNCVVEDEGVFNTILVDEDEINHRIAMIGYHGMDRPKNERSEFGGTLLVWQVRVTFFFLMWGDVEDRSATIQDGLDVADEFFVAINSDSTLGGAVMDSVIVFGDQPMLYTRQQFNEYYMLTYVVEIKENIY